MKHVGKNGRLPLVLMILVFAATLGLPAYSQGQSAGIEPKADQLLQKMSVYVASLKKFSAQTENTLEVVLTSGEKIQFDNPANVSIWRPGQVGEEDKSRK